MRYVVCYDIASNYRRLHVARCLDGYGDRRQKSVFEAVLNASLFEACLEALTRLIEPSEDSVVAYSLCASCEGRGAQLGLAKGREIGNETVFIV